VLGINNFTEKEIFVTIVNQTEYHPQTVTHPGLTLEVKLDEMAMSRKEYALRT
jgi:HTH-type transcriptional regulator / antitoxin HigA